MLICLGGLVAARSVKVVGQEGKQERAIEVRDSWWNELREEIKTHARSLDSSHVIGYTETTSITEEGVCVTLVFPTDPSVDFEVTVPSVDVSHTTFFTGHVPLEFEGGPEGHGQHYLQTMDGEDVEPINQVRDHTRELAES